MNRVLRTKQSCRKKLQLFWTSFVRCSWKTHEENCSCFHVTSKPSVGQLDEQNRFTSVAAFDNRFWLFPGFLFWSSFLFYCIRKCSISIPSRQDYVLWGVQRSSVIHQDSSKHLHVKVLFSAHFVFWQLRAEQPRRMAAEYKQAGASVFSQHCFQGINKILMQESSLASVLQPRPAFFMG